MKARNKIQDHTSAAGLTTSHLKLRHSLARGSSRGIRYLGLCLVLVAIAAAAFYSTSSASPFGFSKVEAGRSTLGPVSNSGIGESTSWVWPSTMVKRSNGFAPPPSFLPLPDPAPSPGDNIVLFAANCTTPQTTFHPGDVVCAEISGIPLVLNIRVDWLGVGNLIVLRGSTLGGDPQNVSFTIPTDAQTGSWKINVSSQSDSSVRASQIFYVSDPQVPSADLSLSKLAKQDTGTAGSDISFDVIVTNHGPDAAASVAITDVVPTGTKFVLGNQVSGPSFTCTNPANGATGTSSCTISSLDPGETATFLFSYKINNGTTDGTVLSNTASVASTTTDPKTSDNTRTAEVTVQTEACVVTCPANITIPNTLDEYGATVNYVVSDNGGCGSVSSDPPSGSFFPVGVTVVSANGVSGNPCSFVVTVNDTQAPTFTSCPSEITEPESPAGSGSSIVNYSMPTAADNDPAGATVNCDHASGSSFPVGTTHVTCTATDAAGNTTNANNGCAFDVIVTTNCSISCPTSITQNADEGSCGAVVTYATPTTNGCSGTETVTQIAGLASGSTFPLGTTTNTFRVTDGSTTSTCSFTVTIVDHVSPTITCPADLNVNAGNACQTTVNVVAPTASDNCPTAPTVTGARDDGHPLGDPYPVGTTDIVWTARDAAGNTSSCTQKVKVRDSAPPVAAVNVPDTEVNALMTVSADANCQAPVPDLTAYVVASDNCASPANISILQAPPGDTLVGPGAHPITIRVSDGDPNDPDSPTPNTVTLTKMNVIHTTYDQNGDPHITIVSTIDMIFTVNDTTPPAITGPGNASYQCATDVPAASPTQATATDACGTPTITVSESNNGGAGSSGSPLVITRVFTATDAAGNHSSATQTITVIDSTPPTITLNGSTPVTVECHTSFVDPGATAHDNCSVDFAATATSNVDINTPGTYTIAYNAHDAAGNNAAAVSRTVIVVDTTAPVITLNGQTPSMWPPNHNYQTFQVTNFVTGVTDSCNTSLGVSSVVIEKVTSDEAENGNGSGNTVNDIVIASNFKSVQLRAEREGGGNGRVYTITFRVCDASGNVGRATAKVVVPHNSGATAVDSGVHYTVNGTSTCP